MFIKFINDLLIKLKSMRAGVRIYDFHLNMFAYADDLNLVSTTAAGLQSLMNYMNYTTSPKCVSIMSSRNNIYHCIIWYCIIVFKYFKDENVYQSLLI